MTHNFKFDIQIDNFSSYFVDAIENMTEEQRNNLPPELLTKLFKINGEPTQRKLHFLQELYILSQGLEKKIFVVVQDGENGLGISDYEKFAKEQKRRKYSVDAAEHLMARGAMVLGNKELIDWISYLNLVSISPAYKYAVSLKNIKSPQVREINREFSYFCNLLLNYEGNKKRIIRHDGITIPELYVLYYLADSREKRSTPAYIDVYRNSVNASRKQILHAFKTLTTKGLVESYGKARATTYKITMKGKERLYRIIHKYMIA